MKDCDVHRLKNRVIYVLRMYWGGLRLWGPPEDFAVCGAYRALRLTAQKDRITCGKCKEHIARMRPQQNNPRSGMRMPLAERYEKT